MTSRTAKAPQTIQAEARVPFEPEEPTGLGSVEVMVVEVTVVEPRAEGAAA